MIPAPQTMIGQIAAYAVGGGAITLLHTMAYWVMAEPLSIDPYLANTLAAIMAGITGYLLHGRWTFGHTNDTGGGTKAQARYIVVSVLCYALNSFWVWLLVDWLDRSVTLSIVPMVLATPWLGFVLNRFWTFAR